MILHWVINASPLIVLGKARLLNTISPLASCWIIPNGVVQEVSKKSPLEPLLAQLSEQSQIRCQSVAVIDPFVASWNLGQGESEVLTLAIENSNHGVVLDDRQARKCAQILALPLVGSLGLVVKAKKEGLLDTVKPAFAKLMAAGLYIDPRLAKQVLTAIGE
jgi:predicted nucleic acid-binding protein